MEERVASEGLLEIEVVCSSILLADVSPSSVQQVVARWFASQVGKWAGSLGTSGACGTDSRGEGSASFPAFSKSILLFFLKKKVDFGMC